MVGFPIGTQLERRVDMGKMESFWTFWIYRGENKDGEALYDLCAKHLMPWSYANAPHTMKKREVAPLWDSVAIFEMTNLAMESATPYIVEQKFDFAPVH